MSQQWTESIRLILLVTLSEHVLSQALYTSHFVCFPSFTSPEEKENIAIPIS